MNAFRSRAAVAWMLVAAPAAHAASSPSYQISNAVLDAAGGTSASASYTITACVGSEVAGSSSSPSHHIDSGCGPSALAIASDFVQVIVNTSATPIPTLSGSALALLVVLLAAAAIKRLRGPSR